MILDSFETKRIRAVALNKYGMYVFINNLIALEKILGLAHSNMQLESHVKNAMEISYDKMLENEENSIWFTNWIIILKKENKIIGGIGFKNTPNNNGEIEIGYGIDKDYWNKGLMTETVNYLTKWALNHENVKSVVAETLESNLASQKVLQKAGFSITKKIDNMIWWRKGI